jgi:hypothetical protein
MIPVSNTDRLVRQIRQRLEERSSAGINVKAGSTDRVRPRGSAAVKAITSPIAKSGIEEEHLQRLIVEHLLVEQLGPKLANDAKFQQVIDQVTQSMTADISTKALMEEVLNQLRHK